MLRQQTTTLFGAWPSARPLARPSCKACPAAKTLADDPNGWYCYTAMTFTDQHVLLGHSAGDRRNGGLNTAQITVLPMKWLYKTDEK